MATGSELIVNQASPAESPKSPVTLQRIKSLSQEPSFKGATIVKVDSTAFLSNVVNVNFRTYHFKFLKTGGEVTDANNWSWTGKADDGVGDAVVTLYKGILVASFHYHGAMLHLDQTASGEYLLEELEEKNGKPTGDDTVGVEEAQQRAAELLRDSKKKLTDVVAAAATTPSISILVAYSAASISYFGSENALLANINAQINDLNSILRTSGINLTTRLAATVLVSYTGARDAASTLTAFQALPNVKAAHDTYNADVMMFVASISDLCGRANVFPAPAAAYGVVDAGCMTTQHTFTHEFGHLLGAGHDSLNRAPNGAQPYAHGSLIASFKNANPALTIQYFWCAHTVMAYSWSLEDPNPAAPCVTDDLLSIFSSPLTTVRINSGMSLTTVRATGNATSADNTRMLNETAATVAAYHNTKISAPALASLVTTPSSLSINVTQTQALVLSGLDQNGAAIALTGTTTWTSANPAIATVDSAGNVYGVAIGATTVKAANGGRSITTSVGVSGRPGINPPTCGRACSAGVPSPAPV